jgi:hypothetical protein
MEQKASKRGWILQRENWITVIVAALFALILLPPYLLHGNYLIWIMDGGVFAYGGQQWLKGGLAYVDFLDLKPPFIFLMNAIGLWLGGGSPAGVVAFAGFCAMGFAGLFLWGLRQYSWAARIAGLAAMFLWINKLQALNSIGCFTLVPHLVILLAFVRGLEEEDWARWALWAGFCGGMVLMARPNQVLSSAVYVAVVLWRAPGRDRWIAIARFCAGGAAVAGFLLGLVLFRGSLAGMWDAMQIGARYAGARPLSDKLTYLLFGFENIGETGLLGVGLGVMIWGLLGWWRKDFGVPAPVLAASLVLALEFGQGAASGRFYSHYLAPAIPACGMLVVWFLDAAGKRKEFAAPLALVSAAAVLVLLLHMAHVTWQVRKIPVSELALAERIDKMIPANASTYTWVWNRNSMPFHLGRKSASKFFTPVGVSISKELYNWLMPEIIADLERNRPEMIADCGPPQLEYLFTESSRYLPAAGAGTGWETAGIRQRLERLAGNYRFEFADQATRCAVYVRR